MAKRNVTVSIDEEAYRNGRIWAAKNETTVSAVVNYCIANLGGLPVTRRAVDSIHRRRNSMVELTEAIEHLSSQLSASANKKSTHCATVQPDNPEEPQPVAPSQSQRNTEITASKMTQN